MTSLLSTRYPNASRATRASFSEFCAEWGGAWLRAIAQVAFCVDALAGALVLAAVFVVSPSSAVAAALGAGVATALGHLSDRDRREQWRAGLTGYNGAVIGLFWGGALAQGGVAFALFPLALAVGMLIERPLARRFAAWGLPPLALAATLIGWGSDLSYRALGLSFWDHPGALPFGEAGILAACGLIFLALWRTRPLGALLGALLAVLSAAAFGWLTGFNALSLASLWGFTAVPIAFALYGVYLVGVRGALIAALTATVFGLAVAALWLANSNILPLPPLLAPFMLTVWGTLWAMARISGARRRGAAIGQAVAAISEAERSGRRVVALTGAGVSTASGIPDYVSGAWLDGAPEGRGYDFRSFLESPPARHAYWQSCARFFEAVATAAPNPSHGALAAMMRAGRLSAVVTQNVDRLHGAAGTGHVIELHGRIDRLRCLSCGVLRQWDGKLDCNAGDNGEADSSDMLCGDCGGLLKPDVVALGENIPPLTWTIAENTVRECGVLLVVGTRLAISSAHQLVLIARRDGARVIFVNTDPVAASAEPGDIVIEGAAEEILPALARS